MSAAPLEFFVLTGFLGSGKTTLLRDFLATPAASDTAVIVNEVGEIGLDGAILREDGGDVPMAMLSNGCICCSMGSDLSATVGALIEAERPQASGRLQRIILETSGLSKPGPILRQLADLASLRMRVAVVATYDALRGTDIASFEEAAAQWGAAHRMVVTKLDAVSQERGTAAVDEAARLNPLAEIVADRARAAIVDNAFGPLDARSGLPSAPASSVEPAHHRISVRLVVPVGTLSYDQLATWLDNLGGTLGERLLRLKGLVRVAGVERPLLVQSVGTLFSEPRPFGPTGGSQSAFLVVIARDLAPRELEGVAPSGLFAVMR